MRDTRNLEKEWHYFVDTFSIKRDRQINHVMPRHAFMVASRKYYTTMEVAKVCGYNHATVVHACKNHESNHRFTHLYRDAFAFAEKQVESIQNIKPELYINSKTHYIVENIKLRQMVQDMVYKLNELQDELRNRPSTLVGADGGD